MEEKKATRPLAKAQSVARYLGLCDKMIYKLANSGELPSVRIGASIRFDWRDVEAFADKHRVGGDK